ncbi:MAG: hypothetical protein U1D41_05120 [Nitrosomonas sp.]|uniref:hypothetical protein n=1 Tax=Nitrosomonas sp. TaxID=42353 RepID=UPI00273593A1|nr:hypothetical protein [Nitrosomonas sp.]MDP3663644.1 hypothetical protein [Nitrosomonas sp.]MDZ4105538.1 hypothetical protein [Nitrosomonas sp.]
MPNALLARYFHEQNLFKDLDFTAMKEGNPAALFEAWLLLPDNQRYAMDTVFCEIFEMRCEKGSTAIIDEAGFQFNNNDFAVFVEKLSALPNHYQRAMITFLDHKKCWKGAIRFYHADTLPHWRKRKNLAQRQASVDGASIKQLAKLNACSFDKGFHSPANQTELTQHLDQVTLPRKGKLSKERCECDSQICPTSHWLDICG